MYKPIPAKIPCWANEEDTAEYPDLAHSVYQKTILTSAGTVGVPVSRRPWREVPNLDTAPPSAVGSDQVRYVKKQEKTQKIALKERLKSQLAYQAMVDKNRKSAPDKLVHPPKYRSAGKVLGGDGVEAEEDNREIFKLTKEEREKVLRQRKEAKAAATEKKEEAPPASEAVGSRGSGLLAARKIKKVSEKAAAAAPDPSMKDAPVQENPDALVSTYQAMSIRPGCLPSTSVRDAPVVVPEQKKLDPLLSTYQAMSLKQGSELTTVDGNRPFVMIASRVRTHERRPFKLDVKPHARYGRRPDALFDGDGYPLPAGSESEFERRARQKKEYAKQWEERAARKKHDAKIQLPVYANKTQAKRYKDKLVSTYGLMSSGGTGEWRTEREKEYEYAHETQIKNTEKGNKGTYYFGQPMQAEDFVEINRGVKRTELSDAGYRGEYDWGDLLYKIDPNEAPLAKIPVRVEGNVTAPESYLDREKGKSKYGEQECVVRRTAL